MSGVCRVPQRIIEDTLEEIKKDCPVHFFSDGRMEPHHQGPWFDSLQKRVLFLEWNKGTDDSKRRKRVVKDALSLMAHKESSWMDPVSNIVLLPMLNINISTDIL